MAKTPPLRAGRRLTDPLVASPAPPAADERAVPAGNSDPAPGAVFEAQRMGQDGQKRGLRAGQPAIDAARSAYLGREWSGRADRRPAKGLITKTRI